MHNRVRMITASYLVKHLLIDPGARGLRRGSGTLWSTRTSPANSTNWQWVAGTGIDSQPYFRVFNPVTQGQKFDPDGAYVRSYVPELARPARSRICTRPGPRLPMCWRQAGRDARAAPIRAPLIDLADGQARALDAYRRTVKDAVG